MYLLHRRTTLYSFLWADFVQPSVLEDEEYLKTTELVLHITLMIIVTTCEHTASEWTSQLQAIARGEEDLLVHLQRV